ncbi:protein of unassigned function [Methylobacterium oryzae CBMB20]|uniref:Protein of unassigned function n=1 Tax=Methylobacterium oryzae CBMB20 TaxID=693986 RepID=A0A089P2C5_9HYPH|nr:protein of unassigned function [Methylobacterium oryzae CBMB20]
MVTNLLRCCRGLESRIHHPDTGPAAQRAVRMSVRTERALMLGP